MKFSVIFTIEVEGNSPKEFLTRLSWHRRKKQIEKRDGQICAYCGVFASDGQPDHIIPLSRGGTDDSSNLAWSCPSCNNAKGNRTLQEWISKERANVLEEVEMIQTFETDDKIRERIKVLHADGMGLTAISDKVYGYHNSRKTAEIKNILGLT